MVQPLWKTLWRLLKKLTVEFLEDLTILFLGTYPERTIIQKDPCTPMFIAALFTVAKTWKQAKNPSEEEWIKKTWGVCVCIHMQWNITQP